MNKSNQPSSPNNESDNSRNWDNDVSNYKRTSHKRTANDSSVTSNSNTYNINEDEDDYNCSKNDDDDTDNSDNKSIEDYVVKKPK